MSENASIARPYAQAAFEMARDSGNFLLGQRHWRFGSTAQEPEVNALFAHPALPEELAGVIIELCGDGFDEAGRNLKAAGSESAPAHLKP